MQLTQTEPGGTYPCRRPMRILVVADLGSKAPWYGWLQAQAYRFGLVAISGDLLDVFSRLPLPAQVANTSAFLTTLAGHVPVAVCSGNHDSVWEFVVQGQEFRPSWLSRVASVASLLADGQTQSVEDRVVVTALGYLATLEQKNRWMAEGARLRSQTGLPWLVLHHHPPATDERIGHEEYCAGLLAAEFQPELWCSGRLYGQHSTKGFMWFQRFGSTSVLNAAQLVPAGRVNEAPFPTHIVVDLEAGLASWHRPGAALASVPVEIRYQSDIHHGKNFGA